MSTSTYRNKNCRRPKKNGSAKRKRLEAQEKRLLDRGFSEEFIRKLTMKDLRSLATDIHATPQ